MLTPLPSFSLHDSRSHSVLVSLAPCSSFSRRHIILTRRHSRSMVAGEANFLGGVAGVYGVPNFDPQAAKERFFEIYIGQVHLNFSINLYEIFI